MDGEGFGLLGACWQVLGKDEALGGSLSRVEKAERALANERSGVAFEVGVG